MAIVDVDIWQAYTGQTLTAAQTTAVSLICAAVDKAIKNDIRRTIERADYDLILPAPMTPNLRLFKYTPIEIDTLEVYYNADANGDPLLFTAGTLLTLYADNGYSVTASGEDSNLCIDGLLYRNNGPWGVNYVWPVYSVAPQRTSLPGSVRCVFTGGYEEVPADLQMAAVTMTTKIYLGRKYAGQANSESWNGYQRALPAASIAALQDPQITTVLDLYRNYGDMI